MKLGWNLDAIKMQLRCNLDETYMKLRCNLEAIYMQFRYNLDATLMQFRSTDQELDQQITSEANIWTDLKWDEQIQCRFT